MEHKYSLPRAITLNVSDKDKNKHYRIEFDGGVRHWMVFEKKLNKYELVYVAYNEYELMNKYKFLQKYLEDVQFNDELKGIVNGQ